MLSTRESDHLRLTSPVVTLELCDDDNDDDDCDYVEQRCASPPVDCSRPSVRARAGSRKTHSRFADVHVVIGLLMSVVGAGMLSVPYTFVTIPTALALASLAVVGLSMATTATALLYALVHAASKEEQLRHVGAGNRLATFQALARVAGGDVFAHIVALVTALGIFGGCVGGIRIVRDLTPHVVRLLLLCASTSSSTSPRRTDDWYERVVLWSSFAFVVFPLCLLKSLSGLRATNYLGLLCSLYLVLTVAYHSLEASSSQQQQSAPSTSETPPPHDDRPTGAPLERLAQAVAIYNFAFMMHLNLLPLFVALRGTCDARPLATTRSHMTRTVVSVAVFCIALYAVLGVASAKLYGRATAGNLLLNLERDAAMAIPLVAVYATVLVTFPLLFHPMRTILEDLLQARVRRQHLNMSMTAGSKALTFSRRFALTLALLGAALVVAMHVPGIEVVFSLIGATTCTLICFVFPVAIFTRVYPWRRSVASVASTVVLWLIVVLELVIGVTTVSSLL